MSNVFFILWGRWKLFKGGVAIDHKVIYSFRVKCGNQILHTFLAIKKLFSWYLTKMELMEYLAYFTTTNLPSFHLEKVKRRRKVSVGHHQILVLAVCNQPFPIKFKVKCLRKRGAVKATPMPCFWWPCIQVLTAVPKYVDYSYHKSIVIICTDWMVTISMLLSFAMVILAIN